MPITNYSSPITFSEITDFMSDEIVSSSIMPSLIAYCSSDKFVDDLNIFKDENYKYFYSLAEEKTSEHSFVLSETFERYKALLDDKVTRIFSLLEFIF